MASEPLPNHSDLSGFEQTVRKMATIETLWPQDCGQKIIDLYMRIFATALATPSHVADVSVILSPGRGGLQVSAHLGGWSDTKQESDFFGYAINSMDQTGLADARYLHDQLHSFLRTAEALARSKGVQP